jgi:hypothetical protein
LWVLSFLDPDRISEEILCGNDKDVDVPHYPKTRVAYFDARTELIQSSLVIRDIKNNKLRIHRLLQEVVRKKLTNEESYVVFRTVTTLLSNCWPSIKFDERNMVDRLIKCEFLFPLVERIRVLFEDAIKSKVFKPSNRCAALFNEVAWWVDALKKIRMPRLGLILLGIDSKEHMTTKLVSTHTCSLKFLTKFRKRTLRKVKS